MGLIKESSKMNRFSDELIGFDEENEENERIKLEYLPNETHMVVYDENMVPKGEIIISDEYVYCTLEILDFISSYVVRAGQILLSFTVPADTLLTSSIISSFIVIPSSSLIRTWKYSKVEKIRWGSVCIDVFGEIAFKLTFSLIGATILGPVAVVTGILGALYIHLF
jgi:hypothetical protein